MSATHSLPQNHEERVRHFAHLIWEEEGRPDGRAEAHWIAAEQRLMQQDEIGTAPIKKPAVRKAAAKLKKN